MPTPEEEAYFRIALKQPLLPFDNPNHTYYATLYNLYCFNNKTIPGEVNHLIGSIYIVQYLLYLCLYTPTLIVMATHPRLYKHTCYRLMLFIGLLDVSGGFIFAFMAGVFSLMGASYCHNTMLLIVTGHIGHGIWFAYCMAVVILALNRCIEIYSQRLSTRLFKGKILRFLITLPLLYGYVFSTSLDLAAIYNSQYSVYYYQIDFSPEGRPVTNWVCISNSLWVMSTLIFLYLLMYRQLKKRAGKYIDGESHQRISSMQRRVAIQSFLICTILFAVVGSYAAGGFIALPYELTKAATIAIQVCSGVNSVIYLAFNLTIRTEVVRLLKRWREKLFRRCCANAVMPAGGVTDAAGQEPTSYYPPQNGITSMNHKPIASPSTIDSNL